MSHSPAFNIIEHNYPNKTEVENAGDHPDGTMYNITYKDVSKSQLVYLTETKTCSQFVRYAEHSI